ncbi:MAG TPA: UvrB/UvrC motif-containing protein [Gemmatimonadaceae bacterium]|nr:UvrB/UvrC motif-containing protein [Gemmatimonadaceae bacterium]
MSRLATAQTSDAQIATMRADVKSRAADRPGVYRMLSENGEVIYVGKSKQVRTRLLSYFRCAFPEDKGARILRQANAIDWDYTPSEFAALLHEMRSIKRFRPRYNVAMKRDARNFCFLRVTRPPAPKLTVVRNPGDDPGPYYGPFQGAQRVEEAVRELNDVLGLRDCAQDRRMIFADQQELFGAEPRTPGCIRYEVRKCLGPCVAGCSAAEYDQRMALARAFLDGTDDGPLSALRAEMEASSERLEFERAAALRDKLHRLEGLREQFERYRFAVDTLSFVYTVPGHDGEDRVYLIRRGRVRGELPAPRSARDRKGLRELADAVFGVTERDTAQVPTHEIDELMLLSAWFRRHPDELQRTRPPSTLHRRRRSAEAVSGEPLAIRHAGTGAPSGAPRRDTRSEHDDDVATDRSRAVHQPQAVADLSRV